MLDKLRSPWRRWRESRREYQLQRALYKQGGGKSPIARRVDTATRAGPTGGEGDPARLDR